MLSPSILTADFEASVTAWFFLLNEYSETNSRHDFKNLVAYMPCIINVNR